MFCSTYLRIYDRRFLMCVIVSRFGNFYFSYQNSQLAHLHCVDIYITAL